ncbi:hypothetical protein BCV70DRAFT_147520, partial [Testicularia cyperi]
MIPRFVQLVVLAGLILFIPSFLYLSHSSPRTASFIDSKTGLAYSSDSILKSSDLNKLDNPLVQVSQGHGAPQNDWAWTWQGLPHNVGDRLKGFVDEWRPNHDVKTASSDARFTSSTSSLPLAATGTLSASPAKDTERVAGVIMPKMGNETAKQALGRSTWHFLHTMTLRFPDKPTEQESETLRSFFNNFAMLYPCGECAHHFQELLKEFPPQVGSRMTASLWLCSLHNEVNKSLNKPEFPCDKLDETYDCGCGPDP